MAVIAPYYPPDYSGAGIQLASVLERLASMGLDIEVLTPSGADDPSAPAGIGGVRVHRLRAPRSGLLRDVVFGVRAAWWLTVHGGWQLLHSVDFSYQGVAPFAVARLRRRPVLVKTTLLEATKSQSLGARAHRFVRDFGYGRADAIIALSDEIEAQLRAESRPRGRVLRIPNGIDESLFRPPTDAERAARREALGLSPDEFVPALCGMRIRRKNALDLVTAVSRMSHRPVHLLLIGPPGDDPSYEASLREAIARVPAGVRVTVIDSLSREEVAEALQAIDVYVLPSSSEGLPNSVLEAMATGLPCVTTDIPGSRDALSEGGGLLVALGDVDALAEALDRLAAEPGERRRLGREALEVASRRYALGRVAEAYAGAYADLIAGSSGAERSSG